MRVDEVPDWRLLIGEKFGSRSEESDCWMGELPGKDSVLVADCSPALRSENFTELISGYSGLEIVVIGEVLHDAGHVHVHVDD